MQKVGTINVVCMPSFQLVNSGSLSRKKYDWHNFTPTPRRRLRGQNTTVVIGLIGLNESSDTLNYNQFFKHSILEHILQLFLLFILVSNKIFCPKN